jgi:hypothetical protein
MHVAMLLAFLIPASGAFAQGLDLGYREAFLKRLDSAIAARDTQALEALTDRDAWRAAGYPDPTELRMTLPKAPLVREKDLSINTVLYKDGNGRLWRVILRRDSAGKLAILMRARACPNRNMRRDAASSEATSEPRVQTWTIFECWPLPQ